jgi:diacylglycerol O-acyltransferase / wax synthase
VSVITAGQGLNMTVVGYLGRLHFGLTGCRELVPDIDTLASYLVDELELLAKEAAQRSNGTAAPGTGAGKARKD